MPNATVHQYPDDEGYNLHQKNITMKRHNTVNQTGQMYQYFGNS